MASETRSRGQHFLFSNRAIHEMRSVHQCPHLRRSLARAFGPCSLGPPVNNPLSWQSHGHEDRDPQTDPQQ